MGVRPPADDIAAVLFPQSRRAILGLRYTHPDEAFYLRQIVDRAGLEVPRLLAMVDRDLEQRQTPGPWERSAQLGRLVY